MVAKNHRRAHHSRQWQAHDNITTTTILKKGGISTNIETGVPCPLCRNCHIVSTRLSPQMRLPEQHHGMFASFPGWQTFSWHVRMAGAFAPCTQVKKKTLACLLPASAIKEFVYVVCRGYKPALHGHRQRHHRANGIAKPAAAARIFAGDDSRDYAKGKRMTVQHHGGEAINVFFL